VGLSAEQFMRRHRRSSKGNAVPSPFLKIPIRQGRNKPSNDDNGDGERGGESPAKLGAVSDGFERSVW
jgi:hypothetical protein